MIKKARKVFDKIVLWMFIIVAVVFAVIVTTLIGLTIAYYILRGII